MVTLARRRVAIEIGERHPIAARERELPIAPLTLAPGDRVTLTNLDHDSPTCQRDHACATVTADANGKMRVAVTADGPLLSVQRVTQASGPDQVTATVLQRGDRLRVSVVRGTGGEPRNIDAFDFPVSFFGVAYKTGDPLSAPATGWGYERNTPEFRRLVGLSQAILEPGDPVSYAPHWSGDLLAIRNGVPAPALVVGTVGDTSVPVSTAIAMARAAGVVEMTQADPAYGIPVDQVLIRAGVVEGIANLHRLADTVLCQKSPGATYARSGQATRASRAISVMTSTCTTLHVSSQPAAFMPL